MPQVSGLTASPTCSSTCLATAVRRAAWPISMQGETATIVVEVKRIAARPVRRRGMRPLVEATVADATGSLRVTFFNQPWLADRYPPGTRLILHGKADGRGRFTVQGHAPTDERSAEATARSLTGWQAAKPARRRPLPGHRRALLDTDPGARARARRQLRRCPRAAAGIGEAARAPARPPRGAARCALPGRRRRSGAGTAPARLRRAAARPAGAAAAAPQPRRERLGAAAWPNRAS